MRAKTRHPILISIVFGTYNRLEALKLSLKTVRESVGALPYEIIVVDGGSTDGTEEFCRSLADVRFIQQGELRGACRAFNEGFQAAIGKYVVALNDDVEVLDNSLEIAYWFMEQHPEVGQGAFKFVLGNETHLDPYTHTMMGKLYANFGIVPNELGAEAGWWGDYYTYGGDNHLSARIWEMGYEVREIPGTHIIHHTPQDELKKVAHTRIPGTGLTLADQDGRRFWELWEDKLKAMN